MPDIKTTGSIAKNTIALTLRMILRLVVSLYTTRVVLHALGVDDFGIYNLIVGFTMMFSFVNSSMSSSISRFIACDLGSEKSENDRTKTFRIAFTIQLLIALALLVVAEVIGVILINHYVDIPPHRLMAANILYQCTLVSLVFNILQAPFNATIIAYERMTAYAYFELIYVFLLLIIAFALQVLHGDLLVCYGFMLVGINIIIFICYKLYSNRFSICKTSLYLKWSKARDMLRFSGADFYANCSLSVQSQGQNIIINRFFGLTANAASGIGSQIYGALLMFSNSMCTAMRPRIIKHYASGEVLDFRSLMYNGARMVSFANLILCIPLIIILPSIISLWLNTIPKYAVLFARVLLIQHCFFSYKPILVAGIHATGRIVFFSLKSGTLYFISIPLQFFIAFWCCNAAIVYGSIIAIVGVNVLLMINALATLSGIERKLLILNIFTPPIITTVVIVLLSFLVKYCLANAMVVDLFIAIGSFIITAVVSYYFILDKESRLLLKGYIRMFLKKIGFLSC